MGEVVVEHFVVAIDQGTTSTRCIVFDQRGRLVAVSQREHHQHYPKPGWVEHDAMEIWRNLERIAPQALASGGITIDQIAAIGITNQRETTVVWNRYTGRPYGNAIVWQDTRTDRMMAALDQAPGGALVRRKAGVPPATYFAAGKLQWILENIEGVRAAADAGAAIFGTMESWLIWNLTGGT
ncbi:MAG TPA: FGGY family carbohydrate kinase, partial [Acidothermaceae bacterium]|nr:FGGY family carbohydrate kinase [Acidothermaceae bacterium]